MSKRKIVFVTGASRGIGLEICSELVDQNFFVIGVCRSIDASIQNVWEEKTKGHAKLFSLDVSDQLAVNEFFLNVMPKYDAPSVLVNNAGVTSDALFHKMTSQQWSDVIGVNLMSLFYITQPIYKGMVEQKFGRIVNISSINAQKGQAGQVNYCVSKAGIHGLTKALALEGARSNVTVNTVSPGYIETDMTATIRNDIKENIRMAVPMKRFGKTTEIAKAVLYLVSEEAEYVTGTNLSINGGLYMS